MKRRHSPSGRLERSITRPTRRPLSIEMLDRLDRDPMFAVITGDQQFWIDPYTATPVPAGRGRVLAAREHLTASGAWLDAQPLPRARLEQARWRLDLRRLLPLEPRLRLFAPGGWINPFSGMVVTTVQRTGGGITEMLLERMAAHLGACPYARVGRMRTAAELKTMHGTSQADSSAGRDPVARDPELRDPALREMERMDLQKASAVQRRMLPTLPNLPGFQLAAHFTPHAAVSGDFYDVIPLGDARLLTLVGDVSGHGMQAALVVATALKTLRLLARAQRDLEELLAEFNDEIRKDLVPGQFITLSAALLDLEEGTLSLVLAGHHPALLVNLDDDAVLRRVGRSGMAIGLVAGAAFARTLRAEVVELCAGDWLIQYTDGVVEARDRSEQMFGEARLFASVLTHAAGDAAALVHGIARAASVHAGGAVDDDLTIFALRAEQDAPIGADVLTETDNKTIGSAVANA